ncbi:MAG: thioredoxin family protein [Terracidiphilus sp.]
MRTIKFFAFAALLALSAGTASSADRDIYPDPSQARADLAAALKTAASTHRRVLLDFGGNWCGDCQVLDLYMHDQKNQPLVEANFVVVHVNVGHIDANLDLAEKYGVPLHKGVPALAVLSDHGGLLYSQKNGEFEAMRHMESSALTDFLVQWKPSRPGCSAVVVNC